MKSISNRIDALRRTFTRHLCDSCVFHGLGVAPLFCDENKETPHLHVHCVLRGFVHPVNECSNYRTNKEFKKEQKRNVAIRRLSHIGIETLCRTYIKERGWTEVTNLAGTNCTVPPVPDMICSNGAGTYALEIKPKNREFGEIMKGVGQCAFYFANGFRPYLVVYDIHRIRLMKLAEAVKFLGIIVYDSSGRFEIVRESPL